MATKQAPKPPTKAAAPRAAASAKKTAPTPRLSTRDGKGGDGLACVQNIVNNDRQTHVYLVQAVYYRERARRAGRDNLALSAALDQTLASYAERQQRLRTSTLLKTTTGLTQWAKGWVDKLKAAVSSPGVGAVPIAVPIAAVALVALVGVCWLAFHKDEPKSAADVLAAYHASQAYGSMSPEQQAAADQALQQTSQGSYQDGKDAADNSLFGQLKTVLPWVVLGFFATRLGNQRKGG